MIRIIIIMLLVSITVSCGRESGRRNNNTVPTSYQQPSSENADRRRSSRTTTQQPISTTQNRPASSNSNKRIYSSTEIFDKYNSAVFMIYTSDGYSQSQGSGFFISKDGLAVSNYHVFKGTTKGYETIKLTNNKQYRVEKVIRYDDDLDYILFKVDLNGSSVNYIPTAQSLPKVGEKVYAIGSPRGLENTFSSGEISQIRDNHLIQISVPIDHGSSGGALINSYGEVIGITTSGLGDSGANLNFAMSIKVIE